ncbi:MAG: peptidoglycan DD-metalloendopeptidase family protein [Candidatus Saccharibacteria bacterium]
MKNTKKLLLSISALLLLLAPSTVFAQTLQDKINTLNTQIKQNQQAVNAKKGEASTLQGAINELNGSIDAAQDSLDLTTLQFNQTTEKINAQNAELEKQKLILKDNLKIVYKQGETTPIEVVASSKNLSDFVAQQQYLSAIKKKIDDNLVKIAAIKVDLEAKKTELTTLSAQQKAQVDSIAGQRAQKATLLAQTKGEEAQFQKVVSDLSGQRKQAEAQVAAQAAAALQSFRSGNLVSLGSVNKGDIIGYMGSTGNSTGTHLHFSVLNGGSFINPNGSPFDYRSVTNGIMTQNYGPATCTVCGYSFHNGIDIANPSSPPVRAADAGQIIFNGWDSYGFGHKVMILHNNGLVTLYGHLLR